MIWDALVKTVTQLLRATRSLFESRSGNFGMMTAILLPVLLAAVGMSIDVARLVNDKQRLRASFDAASLATTSALSAGTITESDAQSFATKLAAGQLAANLNATQLAALKSSLVATVTSTTTGGTKTYSVKVTGGFSENLTVFSLFMGARTMTVRSSSQASGAAKSTNAISLYLVLDRSGSMSFVTDTIDSSKTRCQNYTSSNWGYYPNLNSTSPCYINKIASLKTAAATLFDKLDTIESSDTTNTILRTGAVSFTDTQQTPSAMAWGTTAARNYVTALPAYPTGGTDMTDAMQTAYSGLTAASEKAAQTSKGNTSFYKFIVLMTDGENTGNSSNWNPALDAETLTTCTSARAAGITIYTVAYMAPANGKAMLLSCAGDASNYFTADDMPSLVSAFTTIAAKVTQQATRITN